MPCGVALHERLTLTIISTEIIVGKGLIRALTCSDLMMITLHGASVECLACLKCYYTTEYKLATIQHPCIIEDSNIYQ